MSETRLTDIANEYLLASMMLPREPNMDDLEDFLVGEQLPQLDAIKILRSAGVDTAVGD